MTQREVPTNALHTVHQHHWKDGAIPASVFAPRKADKRIFLCFSFMFKHVLWQKIWLKIWQSFESHNLIPVSFIRSLRNEPWIWHDFGHVAFRGIHLQATCISWEAYGAQRKGHLHSGTPRRGRPRCTETKTWFRRNRKSRALSLDFSYFFFSVFIIFRVNWNHISQMLLLSPVHVPLKQCFLVTVPQFSIEIPAAAGKMARVMGANPRNRWHLRNPGSNQP